MTLVPGLVQLAARGGGLALQGATHVLSAVRTAPKPLHPRGTVWNGEITRHGAGLVPTGVPWLDEPGHDDVIVRVSAAIGLPHGWPDIQGVAIHLPGQAGADLLFASTGAGQITRFMLRLVRPTARHVASTLLPYRGPRGPIMLAATQVEPEQYALLRADGDGPWIGFGRLRLTERIDRELSFDPIRHPLPGLDNYAWVRRLRSPAYRTARQDRGGGFS